MSKTSLPIGKLPPALLARLLADIKINDKRVVVGPGSGLDCAVIEMDDRLLVLKSDPITFASDTIGWYAVQVNANDIATSGAKPRWFLATCLFPPGTSESDITMIARQLTTACSALGISLVGGHTEITHGIDHPIINGTMIGETTREHLITPRGAMPGDLILLTKGIPIEAIALLAREFPEKLSQAIGVKKLKEAADYLTSPGISILRDARIACDAGIVNAMHDPTEGGLAGALWELAEASGRRLIIETQKVFISSLASEVCSLFQLDPLACLASGSLLLTVPASDAGTIAQALSTDGIRCDIIGHVKEGKPGVTALEYGKRRSLPRPERDEIGKLF